MFIKVLTTVVGNKQETGNETYLWSYWKWAISNLGFITEMVPFYKKIFPLKLY